ncbi:MAG: pyruvate, water dikinase [Deltaproteobacteria bacterium]|nr:pyruvate, water dikinase [Deltaproteobacteria bacterium]
MLSWAKWLGFGRRPAVPFKLLFARFRQLLDHNTSVLQLFADAADKQSGEYVFDRAYVASLASGVFDLVGKIVYDLNSIADQKYAALYEVVDRLRAEAQGDLSGQPVVPRTELCIPFAQIDESQSSLVGGKSAHLGEIHNRLQIPMPAGFTITTYAGLRVIEHNGLVAQIEAALGRHEAGEGQACHELCERLRSAKIPADVRRAVRRALGAFAGEDPPPFFAVRSSALGEDGDLSFAGQYSTLLQVSPEGIFDAYRAVLASLYGEPALAYRRARGLPARGLMAVACMRMVRAVSSGVLYTVDPTRPASGRMVVGATRGLASRAVGGGQSLGSYEIARESPHECSSYRPGTYEDIVVGGKDGGTQTVPLPAGARQEPELSPGQLARLATMALHIERYFKQPQDIEWAIDDTGALFVLQARRLEIHAAPEIERDLPQKLDRYRVLLQGRGHVACRGVAAGKVYLLRDEAALDEVPAGAVLVARRASPRLVRVMPRLSAIVTDVGAPTGHMAAVAREFRVPTIVDAGDATGVLATGQEVTLDADEGRIYEGRVEELLQYQLVVETDFEDAPEYRMLRRLLRRITPLGMVDPQSKDFRAERCRSVHDVIRFAHEKAVEEIIELHAAGRVEGADTARRLGSDIPLGLRIIDIGGGLDAALGTAPAGTPLRPEQICSAPMRALWAGLSTPGVWSLRPVPVGLGTFMSSGMSVRMGEHAGRNLAVLSDRYVNLSLNLGYHYNMIDAYLSDDREANHVYFRFLGGASDAERRSLRATMVREILERLDFDARQSGDLVIARLRKLPQAETEERLRAIGRLIGFSRQLDALMDGEDASARYVEAFLAGNYTID